MNTFGSLNESARWSNIALFANTPLARMTIAAPFVAFLIFFNERLRSFLDLEDSETTGGLWFHLLEVRLEVFYFGLVILGASIALYSIFAPRVIKRYPIYPKYLEHKIKTQSENAVAASLEISLQRLTTLTDVPKISLQDISSDSVPEKIVDALHRLVDNEFNKAHAHDGVDSDIHARFYSGTGYLKVDEVLECLINRNKFEWAIWKPIIDGAKLDHVDVFRLEYHFLDYSYPKIRKAIFCLIAVSSAVVLVPTIVTLISVVAKIFQFN